MANGQIMGGSRGNTGRSVTNMDKVAQAHPCQGWGMAHVSLGSPHFTQDLDELLYYSVDLYFTSL